MDPLKHIQLIYERLSIGDFEEQKVNFEKYLKSQKGYKRNQYHISQREAEMIDKQWSGIFEKWNYSIPEEIVVN